jgi:DNA-binding response OmpR family regulator
VLFGRKKRRFERLLIVEDEPLIAFDNERFLTGEGHEVVATVDTVADALSLIQGGIEVDLLLVDVALADGSGVEVAHAANARGIAILFVTGNCPTEARHIADGCLAKPYSQRDLAAAIGAIEAVADGAKPKRLPGGFSLFKSAA